MINDDEICTEDYSSEIIINYDPNGDSVRFFGPDKLLQTFSGFQLAIPRTWGDHFTTLLFSRNTILEDHLKPKKPLRAHEIKNKMSSITCLVPKLRVDKHL